MAKDTNKIWPLVLFVSVLLFPGQASSTNFTPGQLALSGELVVAACDIDPDSRELWVDFGNISARDINMDQAANLSRPFSVRLIGCESFIGKQHSSIAYATITFMGNVSVEDSTVLIPEGEGKGFGIQIRDRYGEILTFGEPSSGELLSDESNTLKFTASLVPVQQHIKAGDFYAVTRFFMDYN